MSIRLLLLRRFTRRYSSAAAPFPVQTPISSEENQYSNHYPANSQTFPNPEAYQPNPHFQPSSHQNQGFHSPFISPEADPPNRQYNAQSSYNQYNAQSSYNLQSHNPAPDAYHPNPNFQHSFHQNQGFYSPAQSAAADPPNYQYNTQTSYNLQPAVSSPSTPSSRSYGFSSAEEAAAERRRRKRRLRIEPPLYALRPNPTYNSSDANNPDKPRLPDSTSALVGNRLNLHNRVQSLIRAGDLDAASYIVRQSVFQSVRPTVFTCNAIIAAMYRAKRYNDAKALFQYFFRQFNIIPNIVSYNNLIVSHCESNEVDDALKVYEHIIESAPYSPSSVTYRHLTKGLIDADRINDAVSLLREMLNKGHGADSLVFNNVILGFLTLGNLEKANELFTELKERCTVYDGVVNATFMDWFFNQDKPKEAMESYRDLMGRNYRMVPATRNVLLETLLRHGKKKEAWDLFNDMLDDHTPPTFQAVNSDTINMMVNECFKEGKVDEAMEVFKRSGKGVKSKPFQMDVAGFNNMIARLSELEMMDEAEQYYKQLCDKSLSPDVNTYKLMIDAYIKVDLVGNMLDKYSKMVELGLRVIPLYANKWFGFLIEKSKASDCLPILSKMADREPKPDVTTYDIVIKGLAQEGNYDAIADVLREMTSHGVGTSVSLRNFVVDLFERQGRRVDVENILNGRYNYIQNQRPYSGPRGPVRVERPEISQQGGGKPIMPWQTQSSSQTSYTEQGGGKPNMPWQTSFSSQTSYTRSYNEHSGNTPQMTPEKSEQGGGKPILPWQTSFSSQISTNQAYNEHITTPVTEQMSHLQLGQEKNSEFSPWQDMTVKSR